MSASARPASLAPERPWPPRRASASAAADGAIEIVGQLLEDAELRVGAGGSRGVLRFLLETGSGYPYEVLQAIDTEPGCLQAATRLQRTLRRGTAARVHAGGCVPRNDHDRAVLRLIEVTTVTAI